MKVLAIGLGWCAAVLLTLYFTVGLWDFLECRYHWNKGVCRKNGRPWEVRTAPDGTYFIEAGEFSHWLHNRFAPDGVKEAARPLSA